MNSRAGALADLSMISANYGNLELAEAIHKDWFRFLGGEPAEVVFVENGSPLRGQTTLFEGVKHGWIDKLLSVRPGVFDIGKHQAFIAEVSALAMATRPFALLYHLDVLVSRRGHDDWLFDAQQRLRDLSVYAIGGSFNAPSKSAEYDEDWYLSKKLSGNFALLPRTRYQDAWLNVAGSFVRSGYREEHPLPVPARRFLMEVGLEQLLESGDWRTMVRRENRDWRILHTNLNGPGLAAARQRALDGQGVDDYLNAGDAPTVTEHGKDLKYFGQPEVSLARKLRIAVGASPVGPLYRKLLGRHTLPPIPEEMEPPTLRELAGRGKGPLDQLSVVVFVDEPSALGPGLEALYTALGGRPAQIVGLVSAHDTNVDRAWQAHVEGCTDKLLVSRSLAAGARISCETLVDHGVFAHAHCPSYLLCNASALASARTNAPRLLEHLHDRRASGLLSFPEGTALERAELAVCTRSELLAEAESAGHHNAVVGIAAGAEQPGQGKGVSARRGAA
jgi:hypothetical protein